MKRLMRLRFCLVILVATVSHSQAQGQSNNVPPRVSIVWPNSDCLYNYANRYETLIKIKADATDADGSIAEVRFFAGTNLIGTVTNPPFNIIWRADSLKLKAVAVDNLGALSESDPVQVIVWYGLPPFPVSGVTSPRNGSVFAAPATFEVTADLLASPGGGTGSVEFFVGTNSVGVVTQSGPFTATMPLYSLTVTNIPEGEYLLSVGKYSCPRTRIQVVRLGMQFPRLTPDSRFDFDVVTSFPTNQNIIEASSNLLNWTAVSTNVPMTNSFTFTEPSPATNSPRFYRAVVPSQ